MTSKFITFFKVFPAYNSFLGKILWCCTVLVIEKASSRMPVRCSLETPSYCSAKKQAGNFVRNKALAINLFRRPFP